MACRITDIKLYTHYEVQLFWELPEPKESGAHIFTVERSGSPEGEWEALEYDDEIYTYIDTNAARVGLDISIFYRIKVVPPSGASCTFYSDIVEVNTILNAEGIEGKFKQFKDRFTTLTKATLQKIYNLPIQLYKRRWWGQKCTLCYDQDLEIVKIGECEVCFGTSYQKGYWNPITLYSMIDVFNKDEGQTQTDVSDQVSTQITVAGDTPINKQDLIVETRQKRIYGVEKVVYQEVQHLPLLQIALCREISEQSVEYRLDELFPNITVDYD
jgi:hypothetical protein